MLYYSHANMPVFITLFHSLSAGCQFFKIFRLASQGYCFQPLRCRAFSSFIFFAISMLPLRRHFSPYAIEDFAADADYAAADADCLPPPIAFAC